MHNERFRFPLNSAWCWHAALAGLLFTLVCGCGPAARGPAGAAPAAKPLEPDAPEGEAIADPVLREAREQADAILDGLLAGKFDQDQELWPVARKLKGFQSASIKSEEIVRAGAADFRGILIGPAGRARFDMHLVKQKNGKWAVGTFGGPNPE
jgi:hypothetical protein